MCSFESTGMSFSFDNIAVAALKDWVKIDKISF